MDAVTGAITGTPTTNSAYNFDVKRGGCTKNFSFSVVNNFWTDFVYDPWDVYDGGIPASALTYLPADPVPSNTNSFTVGISAPPNITDAPIVHLIGGKLYTGPGVTVHAHIAFSSNRNTAGANTFDITVLGVPHSMVPAVAGNYTYDFDWIIPGGVNVPVDFALNMTFTAPGQPAGYWLAIVTLSVV